METCHQSWRTDDDDDADDDGRRTHRHGISSHPCELKMQSVHGKIRYAGFDFSRSPGVRVSQILARNPKTHLARNPCDSITFQLHVYTFLAPSRTPRFLAASQTWTEWEITGLLSIYSENQCLVYTCSSTLRDTCMYVFARFIEYVEQISILFFILIRCPSQLFKPVYP